MDAETGAAATGTPAAGGTTINAGANGATVTVDQSLQVMEWPREAQFPRLRLP